MGTVFVVLFIFLLFFAWAMDKYKNNIYEENQKLRDRINSVVNENIQIANIIKDIDE